MTVTAYVGRPRSGKSYGVVEHAIIPACKEGRPVYTNIPVYPEKLQRDFPSSDVTVVSTEWFSEDSNLESIPGGTLIIMDECWRIFPAGQRMDKVSIAKKSFFAEHGHRVGANGRIQDIILVVQGLQKVASWARTDIDKTFLATKLDSAGMSNKFRIDIYQGAAVGPKYREPDLGYSIQEYKPEIYQYYLSHTMGSGEAGIEIAADKRATVFSHPAVKYGIPAGIISALFLGWSVVSFFTSHQKTAKPQAPQTQPQPTPAISEPPPASRPLPPSRQDIPASKPVPPISKEWRITGHYSASAGSTVVLIESPNGHRRLPDSLCVKQYDEYSCVVDGFTITKYSGPERRKSYMAASDLNPLKDE